MSWWIHVEPPNMPEHEVYEVNVTYNVGTMLRRAGVHPRLLNGQTVRVVRPVIEHATILMAENSEYFGRFDAENGWGTFDTTHEMMRNLDTYLRGAPDDYVMRWT